VRPFGDFVRGYQVMFTVHRIKFRQITVDVRLCLLLPALHALLGEVLVAAVDRLFTQPRP